MALPTNGIWAFFKTLRQKTTGVPMALRWSSGGVDATCWFCFTGFFHVYVYQWDTGQCYAHHDCDNLEDAERLLSTSLFKIVLQAPDV